MDALFSVFLIIIGVLSGFIGGIGGPGGIPVLIVLNSMINMQPTTTAATASSVFFVATVGGVVLYHLSDGIDVRLTIMIAIPAMAGSYLGTSVATYLQPQLFEAILGVVFATTGVFVIYQQRMDEADATHSDKTSKTYTILAVTSLVIGVLAGVTGVGGPALTIPVMLFLGVQPQIAIGAGLASGVIITANSVAGHALQSTVPDGDIALLVAIPLLIGQFIGWKFVHTIPDKHATYAIAALSLIGGGWFML